MSKDEFKKYIITIGFEQVYIFYFYNKYRISLYDNEYELFKEEKMIGRFDYNDLKPLHKISRRYKLKYLLE